MRHLTATFTLVLLFATVSQAQIGLGILGGVDLAKVYDANLIATPKTLTDFSGGVYLEVNIPMIITIRPEALYSLKGYVLEYPTGKTTTTYSYLEVPVLLKYSLPVPVLSPSLYAGPDVGFLLGSRRKQESAGVTTEDIDTKGETTKTDWGIMIGASVQIAVVSVHVRYDLGLTTVDAIGREKAYNRVWSIMVGIPLY